MRINRLSIFARSTRTIVALSPMEGGRARESRPHPAPPCYSRRMSYRITKACTKCGACLPECPTGSIISGSQQFHIDADTCANHAACVNVCPEDAIVPIPGTIDPKDAASAHEEEE
jgi:ferredoxin